MPVYFLSGTAKSAWSLPRGRQGLLLKSLRNEKLEALLDPVGWHLSMLDEIPPWDTGETLIRSSCRIEYLCVAVSRGSFVCFRSLFWCWVSLALFRNCILCRPSDGRGNRDLEHHFLPTQPLKQRLNALSKFSTKQLLNVVRGHLAPRKGMPIVPKRR